MSRAKKTSRKASRKPKTVMLAGREYQLEKDGGLYMEPHRLNAQQVVTLQRKVAERLAIANRPGSGIEQPGTYAREFGLSGVLWEYQPSANAKTELPHMSMQLINAATTIGSMCEFRFTQEGVARQQGAELLLQLADAADRHLKRVRHFAESIKLESSTKLEDWTKRWEELGAI